MAQACSVSHAENKRSLPAWMLKACSVNEVPKTEDQNKQALESSVKIEVVGQAIPIKRKSGRRLKNVDSEGASELVGLQRCEGREKTRRKRVQNEVEQIRDVTIKKERKASEGAALKNSRKRKLENVKSEASSPVSIDDDIELTVEDLVSIAEEYVNFDKEQHELEAVKSTRHKEHFPCPTISTEADTGVSIVNAPPVKEGLFQCTTVARNTRSSEHRGDENKSHQELPCPSSLETTEDVAQDMLNLFLGHLWSKPAGNAKKYEPVESVNRTMETGWHSEVPKLGDPVKKSMPLGSMTPTINHLPEKEDCHSELPNLGEPVKKSMSLGSMNTAMNHVPEKKDWRSELPKLGEPVITKKKSSLRDKVALFF